MVSGAGTNAGKNVNNIAKGLGLGDPSEVKDDTNFDIMQFNQVFEEAKQEQNKVSRERESERLARLNREVPRKPLNELSTGEILIGVKDAWFGIIDDLLQAKFTMSTLTKENRIFFIGLTLIIIVIIMYLYNLFVEPVHPMPKNIEIHNIYKTNRFMNDVGKNVVALNSFSTGVGDSENFAA
jgi:hypothetical protein